MPPEKDAFQEWKNNVNIAWWVCLIHQRCIVVPLRKWWGVQALGTSCALGLLLMIFWAAFAGDPFLWGWVGIWLISFIARRWEATRLARRGVMVHSQYDGWPGGTIRVGRTERIAKLIVEPALIGLFGYAVLLLYEQQGWSPYGLPYFLLAGCFSLPFVELVKQTIWERRTQAMADARIEQQQVMENYRQRYGDS